jgi:thiol-disulfide isomerase/thioredoxin
MVPVNIKRRTIAPLLILCLAFAALPVQAGDPDIIKVIGPDVLQRVKESPGKAVLVNIWATWCAPCVEEFPELLEIRRAWKDRGLEVMLVSADFDSQYDKLKDFLAAHKVDFVTYHKTGKDMAFINSFETEEWTGALPVTLLYDDAGKLVKVWNEKITPASVEAEIATLLERE